MSDPNVPSVPSGQPASQPAAQPPVPQPPLPGGPAIIPPPPSGGAILPGSRTPGLSRWTIVVVIAAVALAWFLFRPHGNPYEKLATEVTQAIENNDMRPVEKDFNAIPRAQLEDHAKVGRLADDLNALGKLKDIKEDTPAGSAPTYHHFQAHFEKGTWLEDMTMDNDGKIASFHVHAPRQP